MHNVTIGADPELFCWDEANKEYVSAHPWIPGTKAEPHQVMRGAIQLDGVAAELNIDPVTSSKDFISNLRIVQDIAQSKLPNHIALDPTPTACFTREQFRTIPRVNLRLGCDADFNGWAPGEMNRTPEMPRFTRFAGGHVHVGLDYNGESGSYAHILFCSALARQLDCYLGLASLEWDDDDERRKVYKAGAFRPKPYGMEYRALGNSWLKSDELMDRVYELTIKAVEKFYDNKYAYVGIGGDVQNILNNGDRETAKELSSVILNSK